MRQTWKEAYRLRRMHRRDTRYRLPQWVFGTDDPDSIDKHALNSAWQIADWDIQPYPLADRLRDYKLTKSRYKAATGRDGPPTLFW